uniref:Uncharacterized protein n=1 Tax=Arundo donax TaxID=35708 RepID=A0A0A9F937_ARUDO
MWTSSDTLSKFKDLKL